MRGSGKRHMGKYTENFQFAPMQMEGFLIKWGHMKKSGTERDGWNERIEV